MGQAIENQMETEREKHERLRNECLDKFTNSMLQYRNNPVFRSVVEALMRGMDPYEIIQELVDMQVEQAERVKEYLTQHASFPFNPNLKP